MRLDIAEATSWKDSRAGVIANRGSALSSLPPAAEGHFAHLSSADAFAILCTSGSTGTPKAVITTHGSASGLVAWVQQTYSEQELACVAASTSICFDLSILEIFATLALGGTVGLLKT